MPYKTNVELPNDVKAVLPDSAQTIFREAFNDAIYEQEKTEEEALQIAWTAVRNAGYEKNETGEYVKMIETFKLEDKEIMSVGIWNGINITDEMLEAAVKSFTVLRDVLKPRIKLGHDTSKWKDGLPALGWITGVRKVGKKLLASFDGVPAILKRLVDKGGYKRVSSEFFKNFEYDGKIHPWALSHVAFLGSDLPAVKDLKDLDAYFSQNPKWTFEEISNFTFDTDNETGKIKLMEENRMSDKDKNPVDLKKFTDQIEALSKKIAKMEIDNKSKDTEIGNLKKDKLKFAQESKTEVIKEFCEKMVKEFKMLPASRDIIINDFDKFEFSEESGYSIPFETFKAFVETHGKVIDAKEFAEEKEKGSSDKGSGSDLDAKAMEFMEKDKELTYEDAVSKAIEADSSLAKAHKYGEKTDEGGD